MIFAMKQAIIVVVCVVCSFAAAAEQWDHWEFDSTAKTVTDGVWTYPAALDSNGGLQITRIDKGTYSFPSVVTPLDLTKPFVDAGDPAKTYTLVDFSPRGNSVYVGDVNLNCEGLKTIGYNAFNGCVNATNELVFPSTLTCISTYPFNGSKLWMKGDALPAGMTKLYGQCLNGLKIVGELDLTHITTCEYGVLMSSNVGSVRFGPGLTKIDNNNTRGFFHDCKSLTNVVFDASSSVALNGAYIFPGCTALEKLDLSPVASISLMAATPKNQAPFSGCAKLKRVIFSHKLAELPSATFYNATALEEVRFKGPPPATLGTPFLGEVSESQNVVTIVELDPNSTDYDYQTALSQWNALTAGGTINDTDSTWCEAAAGSCYASRLLILATTMTISAAKTADVDQSTVSSGAFVISRGVDDKLTQNVVVPYLLSGTAVSGRDYVALSGSATIPAGERSVTIAVSPLYNAELSEPRTLTLTVGASENYEIGTASATMSVSKSQPFEGWEYDPSANAITRGDWVFGATLSGDGMTVGSCKEWPDGVEPLDFSGLVVSSDGTYCQIVNINSRFAKYGSGTYRMDVNEPQAYRVGELTLPEGLKTLDDYCFAGCTNLTMSTPIPASVNELKQFAFARTKLAGDIVLTNLAGTVGCGAFAGAKITSLKFGPKLTTLGTSYGRGFVEDCRQLTNITFDASSTLTKLGTHTFENCSGLTELDVSCATGFETWSGGGNSAFAGCTGIRRLFVGNVACVYPNSISGMANLEEVVFTGLPPTAVFTNYLSEASSTKTIKTFVRKKLVATPNSAGACWNDYAADGTIDFKHSTWHADYLVSGVDASKRPLLTLEKPGLIFIVR